MWNLNKTVGAELTTELLQAQMYDQHNRYTMPQRIAPHHCSSPHQNHQRRFDAGSITTHKTFIMKI